MTEDSWFGVTPEPVAKLVELVELRVDANQTLSIIAQHVAKAPAKKTVLIDCFAGVGGNVIAFARSGRWDSIHAIERDSNALACAKRNADIYEVQDKITWYQGDCFDLLESVIANVGGREVIFASPPWGGEFCRHFCVERP